MEAPYRKSLALYIIELFDEEQPGELNMFGVLSRGFRRNERSYVIDSFLAPLQLKVVEEISDWYIGLYEYVSDFLYLPQLKQCRSPELYYMIVFHELIHWTGATFRLGRHPGGEWTDREKCMEEMIAQFGCVLLLERFNLCTVEVMERSMRYIYGYARVYWDQRTDLTLEHMKAVLALAYAQAEQAVRYITKRSRENEKASRTYRHDGIWQEHSDRNVRNVFLAACREREVRGHVVPPAGLDLQRDWQAGTVTEGQKATAVARYGMGPKYLRKPVGRNLDTTG